ncbi:uncharacterized protein TOT_040000796 [Theileria orientalis strain Shintoku]|uniref:Uncharacterized protein n=1 Tax=Theileria orientalis strain Shintoku TaxID=869250 RepID=J7MF47_THEOR|nr:uncharacterized protein TOT_040000796 [Theileria orientalis strain Shintoku]BAM42429.1 uncharacterized protein TOT_040000796 [Theileria orientalis strain Shintoku]|eukprot:XP_009692730.1 uncharacterized protein TOT_040000796 [Theileria orientalis strain Shintoku]
MDLCISILLFTILSIQNESNFVNCREFTILDRRNTHHIDITDNGLVTVNIKKCCTDSRLVCDYNPSDDSRTFTPNQGYLINKVTKSDAVLWDAKDFNDIYSNKVVVGLNEYHERVFRVYFPPKPPKIPIIEPPKPVEPEPTKPMLFTLDVKIKRSTNEFLYQYDERHLTHTFTPNKGFAIDRVVKGNHQVWKCENCVYPERVLIIPDQDGEPVLRFMFPNSVPTDDWSNDTITETTKTPTTSSIAGIESGSPSLVEPPIAEPEDGGPSTTPQESSQGEDDSGEPKYDYRDVRLYGPDPFIPFKTVKMDPSTYEVISAEKHTTFKFKNNAKCTLVTFDYRKVWKNGENRITNPKFVTYYVDWHDRIVVGDGKKAVFYQFENFKWKHLSTVVGRRDRRRDEFLVKHDGQLYKYKQVSEKKWKYVKVKDSNSTINGQTKRAYRH